MDPMHADKADVVCLVSSDADSTLLASRLREDGIRAIGMGEDHLYAAPLDLEGGELWRTSDPAPGAWTQVIHAPGISHYQARARPAPRLCSPSREASMNREVPPGRCRRDPSAAL